MFPVETQSYIKTWKQSYQANKILLNHKLLKRERHLNQITRKQGEIQIRKWKLQIVGSGKMNQGFIMVKRRRGTYNCRKWQSWQLGLFKELKLQSSDERAKWEVTVKGQGRDRGRTDSPSYTHDIAMTDIADKILWRIFYFSRANKASQKQYIGTKILIPNILTNEKTVLNIKTVFFLTAWHSQPEQFQSRPF